MTTLPSAPFPAPLHLACLTPNEVQARKALAQRARGVSFSWGYAPWALTVTPLTVTRSPVLEPGEWCAHIDWAGAVFEITLPGDTARAWIAARLPDLQIDSLPDGFAAAALEAACDELLSQLSGLQRGVALLTSLSREPSANTDLPNVLALEARHEDEVISARLACGSLGLMLMASLTAGLEPVRNALPVNDLPMCLRATVGYTWLDAAEFDGLQAGDAVLFDQALLTPQGEFWLGHENWGVRVRYSDTGLTVMQPFSPLELTMPSDLTDVLVDDDQPVSLQKLPLRLSFDLGERHMTLGELQDLQEGQSLDLARPLSCAVNLRVNGALVGTGDLVDIDGRLGVTIKALAKAAAP